MIKRITGILSNTKTAVAGFLLILIPCIILSYLDYKAISKREGSDRLSYKFTLDFIRDKIEHEIISREEKLSAQLNELQVNNQPVNYLRSWLSSAETQNPIIMNPFLIRKDGGIILTLISSGWEKSKIEFTEVSENILSDFKSAENAEFIEKKFSKAADLYNNALKNASSGDSIQLLMRIGRCYFNNHDYVKAIGVYKQLLDFKNPEITFSSVPVPVIALSQTADVYTSMHEYNQSFKIQLDLYKRLLENPWDVSGGNYFYYLKTVSAEIQNYCRANAVDNFITQSVKELNTRQLIIYRQDSIANVIRKNIIPKLEISTLNQSAGVPQLHQLQYRDKDSVYLLGYFLVPGSSRKTEPCLFVFQLNKAYLFTTILPEIIKQISLENNLSAGLIDNKDNILYIHDSLMHGQKYLIAENFSQVFTQWRIALFNLEGKSIDQIVDREKQQSFLLFGLTVLVMLIGIIVIVITALHEYRVSQMKSNFVSNVSHELKTPLSIVRMFSETLESGIVTDANKQHEFYVIIKRESERLSNLINNLLDFSKIESRKKEFNFEEINLVEVVQNIAEMYKPQLIVQGFMFDVRIPSKEIIARVDKDAISQAILNLINNAEKYSNENKYILVEMYKAENSVSISVTDKGMGISKKEYKNIFEYFYRIQDSNMSHIKGTGLGLTIAKYIIDAHKGTITVQSEMGKGSKFTITIPA
jgi:signal transduction histidine kinase